MPHVVAPSSFDEGGKPPPSARVVSLVESRLIIRLLAVALALPMLLAPILPLVDLGGHIGRYAIQLDAGRTSELARWYTFAWGLLPNLGADIVVQIVGPLIGVEPAARFVVVLAVLLQASGILVLSRKLHGRISPWALLALPLVYSYPFHYGFINFVLSLALALWAMIAWIHFESAPPARRWAIFVLVATGVWVCHLVGWGVFCILAGSRELVRRWRISRSLFATLRDTALTMCSLLIPLLIGVIFSPTNGETGQTTGWFEYGWKLLHLINVMLDRWELFDRLALTFVLAAIIWGLIIKEARTDRGIGLAAVILFVCALAMPSQMLGSHYADIRLFPTILTLALLSLAPSPLMSIKMLSTLLLIALAFAGLRLVGTFASSQLNGREMSRELALLDKLPRHSQLVTLRARECIAGMNLVLDRATHFGGYAIVRRGAFSNDQWQTEGAQLLRIHNTDLAPFDQDPSQFTFTVPCRGNAGVAAKAAIIPTTASHLWVVWDGEPKPLGKWQAIAQGDTSVLYERND